VRDASVFRGSPKGIGMKQLVTGLHTFRHQIFQQKRQLFAKLSQGQSPQVAFISCSDSRVVPGLLTQTEPGELFIIRNAGNFVPPSNTPAGGEAASLEYAVQVLKVRELIICGHSSCGAVNHLIGPDFGKSQLPLVDAWVEHGRKTRDIMEKSYPALTGSHRLNVAIQENVLVQLEHLRTYPFVEEAIQRGELEIHGWVYKIETGEVFSYDFGDQQFLSVEHRFPMEASRVNAK